MWAIIWACVQMYLCVCGSWWVLFSTGKKCLQVLKVTTCFNNTHNSFISTDQGRFDSTWYEPFRKQHLPASYPLLLSCSMTGRIRALLTICQRRPQMSQAVSAFDGQLLCCGVCVTALTPICDLRIKKDHEPSLMCRAQTTPQNKWWRPTLFYVTVLQYRNWSSVIVSQTLSQYWEINDLRFWHFNILMWIMWALCMLVDRGGHMDFRDKVG